EVFYVHSGRLIVYFSEGDEFASAKRITLGPGDKFHVPVGLRHQMKAVEDTVMFEFSTEHFDEDSHRIKKGD
ncbi:MAG: cupin domain-containing protein, partial [Candidatus Thorarchaeota archaeon]